MKEKYLSRQLTLETRSADTEARCVPVTISSEFPVDRDFFTEILSHDRNAVDLSRAPLPLLEGHDQSKTNVGLIEDLHLDGDKLRGTARFGTSTRAAELWGDVKQGIVRNLSIGYRVFKWDENLKTKPPTPIAVKWMPTEASIVSVPADSSIGINRSNPMPEENTPILAASNGASEVRAERQRLDDIHNLYRNIGAGGQDSLPPGAAELYRSAIANGTSLEVFRARFMALVGAQSEAGGATEPLSHNTPTERMYGTPGPFGGGISIRDRSHDLRAGIVDTLLIRAGWDVPNAYPSSRDLQGYAAVELGRMLENSRGGNMPQYPRRELARDLMGHSTGDFPLLMSDTFGKALKLAGEKVDPSYRRWVKISQARDYKDLTRIGLGGTEGLKYIPEGGEFKNVTLAETGETFRILKHGAIFSLTREAIVNDDLDALKTLPAMFMAAATRKKIETVYGILTSPPNMSDGVAFLHSTHKNIGTGGAPSATTLSEARRLMRAQKLPGEQGYLGAEPRFLIVPPIWETEAGILVSAQRVDKEAASGNAEKGAVNAFSMLDLITVPELGGTAGTDTGWFLVAGNVPSVEMAYLQGTTEGVSMENDRGWSVDGLSYKVRLEMGAAPVEYRSIVSNAGA